MSVPKSLGAPAAQLSGFRVEPSDTHEFKLVQVLPPPGVELVGLQVLFAPQVVPLGQQKVLQLTGALAGHAPPLPPGVLPLPPLPEPGPLPGGLLGGVVVAEEHLPVASQVCPLAQLHGEQRNSQLHWLPHAWPPQVVAKYPGLQAQAEPWHLLCGGQMLSEPQAT